MSAIPVLFYKDKDGCPVMEWLDTLPPRAFVKGAMLIDRLKESGHALRRPEVDYLREHIYELRWKLGHTNYRILYFFHGQQAVILAHGLIKKEHIPDRDIDLAVQRSVRFLSAPEIHSHMEELP
ncbi:MAG: type II toxin-antitoxin system RelE/ParE family toxin [Elusimicrobiota bacterium]